MEYVGRRPRVYIAGPMQSSGNVFLNIDDAIILGTRLLDDGFAVYMPQLTVFWHYITPKPRETWLAHDFQWVAACDALLRLPGESPGADDEIKVAVAAKIPVFYSLDTLYAWKEAWRG